MSTSGRPARPDQAQVDAMSDRTKSVMAMTPPAIHAAVDSLFQPDQALNGVAHISVEMRDYLLIRRRALKQELSGIEAMLRTFKPNGKKV